MIAFLRGRLLDKHPNRIVLDVQGVGYDLHVPVSCFARLPETGSEVSLRVHTHVREDDISLFGFVDAHDLQVFERLIAISGIGPRLALAVLSGIEAGELSRAVQHGDIARLTAIPGIGKKTAERIALELKDRLPAPAAPPAEGGSSGGKTTLKADLMSALLNLGYQRAAADGAVGRVLEAGPAEFEPAFRRALALLAR